MNTTTHTRFDVAEYLIDDETIVAYLDACLEEGGTALFQKAIGEVSRARGMSNVAKETGLTRASLYKALSEEGNPAFNTMACVMRTLGLRLSVVPLEVAENQKPTLIRAMKEESLVRHLSSEREVSGVPRRTLSTSYTPAAHAQKGGLAMAAKKSGSGPATARSAGTGKFVTPAYAKKHPCTTVVEHNRKPAKKK